MPRALYLSLPIRADYSRFQVVGRSGCEYFNCIGESIVQFSRGLRMLDEIPENEKGRMTCLHILQSEVDVALGGEPQCHFVNARKQPSKKGSKEVGFCNFVHNFEIGSVRSYARNQLM